ncbi:unnamed protein product [Prorocentrum cordatum]|uniref:Uncharacterized protein n=1 Tax=Prorocentrum cordatum TaxID=2364126 RepID=A0ABN9X200_9DINO|nr:unnamed protein product [Polarella glacialis]
MAADRSSAAHLAIETRARQVAQDRAWLGPWDLLVASRCHGMPVRLLFDAPVSLQHAVDVVCGEALCAKLSVPSVSAAASDAGVVLVATTATYSQLDRLYADLTHWVPARALADSGQEAEALEASLEESACVRMRTAMEQAASAELDGADMARLLAHTSAFSLLMRLRLLAC